MPANSVSRPVTIHDLVAYGAGLFGVSVLLYQAWRGTSLEHILSSAAMSGLIAYLTLAIGFAAARSIITSAPDPARSETSDASPEESSTEPDENDDQPAPEPQAA